MSECETERKTRQFHPVSARFGPQIDDFYSQHSHFAPSLGHIACL